MGAATVVVAVLALGLTLLGVTSGEVAATLLFLPVFVAGLVAGRTAGYVAAALATAVYVAVRRDDLSSAATAGAGILTLTRAGAYAVAGHVGALARSLGGDSPATDVGPDRTRRGDSSAAGRPVARDEWAQVWEPTELRPVTTDRSAEPVLAGVGSSLRGGYGAGPAWPGDEGGNGVYSNPTMSGAWPPEQPGTPWADEGGRDPSRGHVGPQDETPWSDDGWSGPAGPGPSGWPGGGGAGGRGAPPADDSWNAVQQSWREQHGLPPEEEPTPEHGDPRGWDDRRTGGDAGGWPAGNGGAADAWAPAGPAGADPWAPAPGGAGDPWSPGGRGTSDAWGSPQGGAGDGWGPGGTDTWGNPGGAQQADPWGQAAGADQWERPAEHGGRDAGGWPSAPPDDPWADRAPTGGTWPEQPASSGGWPAAPDAPADPGHTDLGGWPQMPADPGHGWPAAGDRGDAAWGSDAPGWPHAPPSGQAGWRSDVADTGTWPAEGPPPEAHDGSWGAPDPRTTGSHGAWGAPNGRTTGAHDDLWGSPEARSTGAHENLWGAPEAPPRRSTGEWPAAGGAVPAERRPRGRAGRLGRARGRRLAHPDPGRSDARWDGPESGPPTEQWAPGWAPGATGNGAAPAPPSGRPTGGGPAGPRVGPLPAVDPETGLWTAQFLRDRLNAEQARSRRSGHPYSLVLVQVPDGPLAQLPYRRQLTLLRELGYQFVAGGVVDHLVHVPDQNQHWFAVILPDTDRSGAHVLERRLRLGIGGYLSSRGLRLRELESASLTAPDDDPAMGAIWDALIGSGESP